MSEKILVCVAWPYVNGDLHLGHIAGCYLPADIFARYHRLKGNDVLMVTGSDRHGTPTSVKAEQEGKSPEEVADFYHARFLKVWGQLGISFDLYTHTGTENHAHVAQGIFLNLLKKKYIEKHTMESPYCPKCRRFLPDRYVRGTCPRCGNTDARGDQCDGCQSLLDPTDLIDWRCGICGSTPELRQTEHFFLRLDKFNERLAEWVSDQSERAGWRTGVRNETLGWLKEGLKERAITRDLEWGVRIPIEGFDDKRIYVWFEAVIGYLSASIEWAHRHRDADRWKHWWFDQQTKSYYFIGKDNIPFHTIIWPAILMGVNDPPEPLYESPLILAYDVPANQHLTIEQSKFAKRTNWAIWVFDFLSRYDPDPLRYALSANMPEASDADFSWDEFVRRNNDELVATYGNAVHRVLTIAQNHFNGEVPSPGVYADIDCEILGQIDDARGLVESALSRCNFREAIRAAMAFARALNVYVDRKAPWKEVKEDRNLAATTIYVGIQLIANLRVLFAPFLPFSSAVLGELLGLQELKRGDWQRVEIPAGTRLQPPRMLFKKLDHCIVEEEKARIGTPVEEQAHAAQSGRSGDQSMSESHIIYDDFMKVELRTAKVVAAERVEGADKLLKLQLDLGLETRQIVAGIAREYSPESLVGKTIVVVANLQPRKVRGVESNGMLLAAGDDAVQGLVTLDKDVPPGIRVR